jgi:hypothetical protein
MKNEDKYLKAETSLEEEKVLFENNGALDEGVAAWVKYVQKSRKTSPKGLKERLWSSISNRTKVVRFGTFAAAASILMVFAFYFISNSSGDEMSLAEKKAKLEEVYAMLDEPQNIIYEDELIILYTE